jgi:A/G-specific adenine glycosylase
MPLNCAIASAQYNLSRMNWSPRLIAHKLLDWYDQNRRDLPWRLPRDSAPGARLDPYHVWVSETMLQQTQAATVIPYFTRFIEEFPTIRSLAQADQQQILRLWQGLGYYSRARNLHKAAIRVVENYKGELPPNLQQLQALPGVGPYTAGAIASIAFGIRAPVIDGNVARVLCRLDRIEADPRQSLTRQRLWRRAEQLVPQDRAGDFNSALMELGATVCTARNPECSTCPLRTICKARAAGIQHRIPMPRARHATPLVRRWTLCIRRGNRWLIEQRPETGRWAGMWQFATIPASGAEPSARTVQSAFSIRTDQPRRIGAIAHSLTHRRYEFGIFVCAATRRSTVTVKRSCAWVSLDKLDAYPLPRPHLRIAKMLANLDCNAPILPCRAAYRISLQEPMATIYGSAQ